MCGCSFSGKSTVAGRLALDLDAEIVILDSINEERGMFGGQGIPVEEWIRTNDEAARRVSRVLRDGRRVVVDDTSSPRFLRDNWRAMAKEATVAFALVYVDTPDQVRRERLLVNREESHRSDVLDEVDDRASGDFSTARARRKMHRDGIIGRGNDRCEYDDSTSPLRHTRERLAK